ncbi:MAG: hypothetical protein H5T92_07835, partial [Synergistales bacterium]|nr:hypothetical protein [Synergistales bacterium]
LYSVIALGIMVNFDLRHSRSLVRVICFVGSVVAGTSLYQFFFEPSLGGLLRSPHWIPGFELVRVRAGSAMGASPIVTGAYLALIVPLGLALLACEPSRLARWFHALQVGLMVVALAVTFSRSAWVQLAVSFALLAALLVLPEKWQAARIPIAGLVCLTVALVAVGFVVCTGSVESPSHPWLVAGNQVRVLRWYTSLSASDVEQLLVGYGPGVTWPMFASGQAEFGMVLRRLEQLTPGVSSTESFALMLFLDLGILGLLTFFAQLWVWIRSTLGAQPGAYGRGKTWPLSWALASALAGAMVSALVSITLASWQVAALMWTYAGLSSVCAGHRDSLLQVHRTVAVRQGSF